MLVVVALDQQGRVWAWHDQLRYWRPLADEVGP